MKKIQFLKQKNMIRVLQALAPVFLTGVYFFGWRVAALLIVSNLFCFLTEWYMENQKNGKVSYACFVTGSLYALSLPPTIPFWIAATGAVIAILFAKEVFGGFGKNVFNPAIVGRAFIYVCFPLEMTSKFVPVFKGFPGGFTQWGYASSALPYSLTEKGLSIADAVTTATPIWSRRDFGFTTDLFSLFTGSISDIFTFKGSCMVLAAGSTGEVSTLVLLISAVYLIFTKTAQWRLMVSTLAGALILNCVLRYGLGLDKAPPLLFTLCSGALMYGAVFMVTDPVSAPRKTASQWIYGLFIGMMIVFFRNNSIFAEGAGFAILLGNMLAPSLDFWIERFTGKNRKES